MKSMILRLCAFLFFPLLALADTVMVIDAGSSGTRAYVYETTNNAGDITVTKIIDQKVSPAVTSVTDFNTYFSNLLTLVQSGSVVNADTPIYLYATAGVRMLPRADQTALLANIRAGLSEEAAVLGYPDMTATLKEDVRVISAAEEAYFIWINDQYVAGKLELNTLNNENTFAAVEMGGASAEVALLPLRAHPATLKNSISFPFYDRRYSIYSVGYDGSGLDKAIAHMLDAYERNGGDFAACFPVGAPYPLTNPVLTGTGEFEECATFIKRHPANQYRKAPSADQYLLTGGFYYTFKILGLANDNSPFWVSLDDLATEGTDFCTTSWTDLQSEYPSEGLSYLLNYCFNSAFQHHYLEGIGVNNNDLLMSTDKYNGNPTKPMTWTLGVAYRKAQ